MKIMLIASACLSVTLAANLASAHSNSAPAPAFQPPPAGASVMIPANVNLPAGTVVHVNPTTLRTYLLSGNRDVLTSLNDVLAAKETVNLRRGQLLPAVNITAIVSRFPNFASAAVQVLLPFLIPSNWFNLDMSKHQLAASGYAFYLMELNDYASAISLYETVVGDIELNKVLEQQYKNLTEIRDLVRNSYQVGTEVSADVAQAVYQADSALGQVQKLNELVAQEQSTIRGLLGLPLSVKLVFDDTHRAAIPQEQGQAQSILNAVNPVSAEFRQLESLIAASKDNKKNAIFSFLTGAAVNLSTTGIAATGQVTGGIGFSYIPGINIANLATSQLKIQEAELRTQEGQTIESALASIREAKGQVAVANDSVKQAKIAFAGELNSYKVGEIDLLHALQASTNVILAETTAVQARIDLDNQRLMLERVLVSGEFAQIPTCALKGAEKSGGIFGILGDFLGGKKSNVSVDDLCGASASAVQQAASGKVISPIN